MRKPVLAMLVLLLCLPILSAEQNETQENLYALVVPTYYDMLSVTGCFGGGTAARMQLDLAPTANFNFDIGAGATYDLVIQAADTLISIDANLNSLFIGTTDIGLDIDTRLHYKSYSLDIAGMQGFYGFGADDLAFDTDTSSTSFDLAPYASIGIGRMHDISRLKELELWMRYLGVEPTAERLEQAARVEYRRDEYLNRFTDYETENYVAYYQQLADAFGKSDSLLEFLYLDQAQAFQFDQKRYQAMKYGWEAEARLKPVLDYRWYRTAPKTHMRLNLDLLGTYAAFTMDDMLYYHANLMLSPGILLDGSTTFVFNAHAWALARYLPPSVPWYVDGRVSLQFDTEQTTRKFQFRLAGTFNYLIHPLLVTFAGLEFSINNSFTTQSLLAITAGGSIRLR